MIKTIIFIIIILIILNNIYPSNNKVKENYDNYMTYNDTVKIKRNRPIYGTDQFITKNLDYNLDSVFKFNNDPLILKNKNLELTDNIIKKYNPKIILSPKNIDIDDKIYKNAFIKTNLPSQQDSTWDFQSTLYQPSNTYDNEIIVNLEQNKNQQIKDVFNSLLIDYKVESKDQVLEVNNIDLTNNKVNVNYEAYNDDPLLSSVSVF
jgi:hypothetical protein